MARADYPCPDCGTTITIYGRNRRDADYQASRATRVCDDCSKAAFAKANAEAAASNAKAGLPDLQGTPKQISWAETIRRQILDRSESASIYLDACYVVGGDAETVQRRRQARAECFCVLSGYPLSMYIHHWGYGEIWRMLETRETWDLFVHALREQDEAHWWIDHRDAGIMGRVEALAPKIIAAQAAALPGAAEQSALEEEVKAEAVLLPACELAGQRIAEVSYLAPDLRVAYDVKNDALRELLKGRGFAWDNTAWRRTLDARHGDPVHRVAETAHLLLAHGFQVRVMDNAARAMAISGAFEPETTRWLRVFTTGKHKGWVLSSWARFEDYYDAARAVLGSKYVPGSGVAFPPGSVNEAMDFAERHGFAVSQTVHDLLAAHEAELTAGIVVDAKKPKATKVVSMARPALAAVEEGIDVDLLDHD